MARKRQLKDGSRGRAICSLCKKLVSITFAFQTLKASIASFCQIPVLAGNCNECGNLTSIPQQSVDQIKKSKKAYKRVIER